MMEEGCKYAMEPPGNGWSRTWHLAGPAWRERPATTAIGGDHFVTYACGGWVETM
jgi:hypothetical protein